MHINPNKKWISFYRTVWCMILVSLWLWICVLECRSRYLRCFVNCFFRSEWNWSDLIRLFYIYHAFIVFFFRHLLNESKILVQTFLHVSGIKKNSKSYYTTRSIPQPKLYFIGCQPKSVMILLCLYLYPKTKMIQYRVKNRRITHFIRFFREKFVF